MKRTILSSFFFLYPVQVAYGYRDIVGMNASIMALAISCINHSHTYHSDGFRRKLFGHIDQLYMIGMFFFSFITCLRLAKTRVAMRECIRDFLSTMVYIAVIYGLVLKGYKSRTRAIEHYTSFQKNVHVFFHFFTILRVTSLYKKYKTLHSLHS